MRNLLISVAIFLVSVCQAGTSVTSLKEQSKPTYEAQTGENVTRLVLFKLNLEPGSAEEQEFRKKTLALAADEGVKEMGWLKIEGGKTEFTHGVRIVFYNEAAIKPYVQSKAHRDYIRDVWMPVVGVSQLVDYTEPDIAKK